MDAGALVTVDRRDRMIGAQLRVLQQQGTPIRVSAAVVGQVWRDGRLPIISLLPADRMRRQRQ